MLHCGPMACFSLRDEHISRLSRGGTLVTFSVSMYVRYWKCEIHCIAIVYYAADSTELRRAFNFEIFALVVFGDHRRFAARAHSCSWSLNISLYTLIHTQF